MADPHAEPAEAKQEYGLDLVDLGGLAGLERFHMIVGAVAHQEYRDLDPATLAQWLEPGGTVADVKRMWNHRPDNAPFSTWAL